MCAISILTSGVSCQVAGSDLGIEVGSGLQVVALVGVPISPGPGQQCVPCPR
jgi:hypothetical protein